MAVRVKVDHPLAVEDLDERFHREVARGQFGRVAAAFFILSRYSCALMNCSRTSETDLARVPGNAPPPVRIELVPLANLMPPMYLPSLSRIRKSSILSAIVAKL
jgi:hypothetical protein